MRDADEWQRWANLQVQEELCREMEALKAEENLDGLTEEQQEILKVVRQFVAMPLGRVLYESGDTLRHVYFPTDCIVSLLSVTQTRDGVWSVNERGPGRVAIAYFPSKWGALKHAVRSARTIS
jgi:hypothetical protein